MIFTREWPATPGLYWVRWMGFDVSVGEISEDGFQCELIGSDVWEWRDDRKRDLWFGEKLEVPLFQVEFVAREGIEIR